MQHFRHSDPILIENVSPVPPPPPPPRRYQLISIPDDRPIQRSLSDIRSESESFTSFGKAETDVINRRPKIVDERRKPYYYNELTTNTPIDLLMENIDEETNVSTTENEDTHFDFNGNEKCRDDELMRNTMFNARLAAYSSGGSLNSAV